MRTIIDATLAQFIAFLGALLGAVVRTTLPYFQKAKTDPTVTFDRRFGATLAISVFEGVVFVILIFINIPVDLAATPMLIFLSSFAFAYTVDDLQNRIITPALPQKSNQTT